MYFFPFPYNLQGSRWTYNSNLSNNYSSLAKDIPIGKNSQRLQSCISVLLRIPTFYIFFCLLVLFSFQTTQSQGLRFCPQCISAYNITDPNKHCLLYDPIMGRKEYFLNKPSDCIFIDNLLSSHVSGN